MKVKCWSTFGKGPYLFCIRGPRSRQRAYKSSQFQEPALFPIVSG